MLPFILERQRMHIHTHNAYNLCLQVYKCFPKSDKKLATVAFRTVNSRTDGGGGGLLFTMVSFSEFDFCSLVFILPLPEAFNLKFVKLRFPHPSRSQRLRLSPHCSRTAGPASHTEPWEAELPESAGNPRRTGSNSYKARKTFVLPSHSDRRPDKPLRVRWDPTSRLSSLAGVRVRPCKGGGGPGGEEGATQKQPREPRQRVVPTKRGPRTRGCVSPPASEAPPVSSRPHLCC